MTTLQRTLLLLSASASYFQTVTAQPTVAFPFNAQLPPVARIGQLFSYTFAEETFSSESDISYSLGDHPEWLSMEGAERRLYGIPENSTVESGSIVGQDFQVIATDDSGSVTMNSTIVISRDPGPTIKIPISEQIKEFGSYSAPSSLLTYPATNFEFSFDQDTFEHEPEMINYYASSGNGSPLPAWVHFDAKSLTFSGTTPAAEALSQPPQTFGIRLVASDIEGFSSTSVDFSIVVGSHKLTAETPVFQLNATRGSSIKYSKLPDSIKLDDKVVQPSDLTVTTTNFPDWLSFDSSTWIIQGKPGKDDHSTNFTISFKDSYSDILNVLGIVNVATGLFESTFHDVEVMPGEDFSMDLASHFRDPSDITLDLETKPDQTWLKLDDFKLGGKVPKTASGDLDITIQAKSKESGDTETESFGMTFLAVDGSTTTTPTTTSSGPSETGSGNKNDDDNGEKDESKKDKKGGLGTSAILLATIIPVLAVALIIMLLVCLIRRRRNRQTYLSKSFRTKISKPVAGSFRKNGEFDGDDRLGSAEAAESHVFGKEKTGYTLANSHRTSRSSDTLGSLSSHDNMSHLYMLNAGPETSRILGSSGSEGRESWFTVDRATTAQQSGMSTRSRGSDATVPFSTHQLLPTPPFLPTLGETLSSQLDLPTLEELPSMQSTPQPSYQPRGRSTAMYSTITTSSAALPLSRPGSPRSNPPIATAASIAAGSKALQRVDSEKTGSDKDWSTIHEDESAEKVPELPPPSFTRLSSHQWLSRRNNGGDGSISRDSFLSEISFSSTENWRVIGGQGGKSAPNLLSYNELVASSPFHPSRPVTPPGPMPERAPNVATSTIAPVRGDGMANLAQGPSASRSKYSKLNEEVQSSTSAALSAPNWTREDSGRSDGSFKAFI